jgi:hypothetical protein
MWKSGESGTGQELDQLRRRARGNHWDAGESTGIHSVTQYHTVSQGVRGTGRGNHRGHRGVVGLSTRLLHCYIVTSVFHSLGSRP